MKLADMFLEDDGKTSLSRVLTFMAWAIALGLLVFFVIKKQAFPDAVTLGALAMFANSPYLINQARATIQTMVMGKTSSAPPASPPPA